MKVLIIKEIIDLHGSIESFKYNNICFKKLLELHIYKLTGITSILNFETDYVIINREPTLFFKKNYWKDPAYSKYFELKNKAINVEDIDYEPYDIIWCKDAILDNIKSLIKKYKKKLFIYEDTEHHWKSKNYNYDFILDHTNMDLKFPTKLNTSISFPYVQSPDIFRKEFDINKEKEVFFEYRDISKYLKENTNLKYDNLINIIQNNYDFKLNSTYLYSNIYDNKKNRIDNETKIYCDLIAKSKYGILTSPRLGQTLPLFAAFKCIAIGNKKSINSKLICHPFCIFDNFTEIDKVMKKILEIENNQKLYNEILEYQDNLLYKNYVNYQYDVLKHCLKLKHSNIN